MGEAYERLVGEHKGTIRVYMPEEPITKEEADAMLTSLEGRDRIDELFC